MKRLAMTIVCMVAFLVVTTAAIGIDHVHVFDEYMYGFGIMQKTYLPEGAPRAELFEVERVECGGPAAQAQVRSGDILYSITIRDEHGTVLKESLTRLVENNAFRTAEVIVIRPLDPIIARLTRIPMLSERKTLFSGPVTGENRCE